MKSKVPHRHEHIDRDDTEGEVELPHHGRINPDYGQRYPPHASSEEEHIDRGVATQVETHRNYLKQQQEVFGDTLPTVLHDKWMANAFTELLDSTKKLYRLERARVPIGRSFTIPLTISGGSAVTHINFLEEGPEWQRWAPGMFMEIPGRKVMSLTVFNDGAGVVAFETNISMNTMRATNKLTSGVNQTISYDFPVIESVNIVSTSGNNSVRMLVRY